MTQEELETQIFRLLKKSGELCYPPVSNQQLNQGRKSLGIDLPEDLMRWLTLCNGTLAGAGGIYGLYPEKSWVDAVKILGLSPEWRGLKWIPVASDGCGNFYVLVCGGEAVRPPVAFVDTIRDRQSLAYAVGSNLWTFIYFYLHREYEARSKRHWPFDKKWVLGIDPDFANVKVAPLPWELEH